MSEQDRTEPEVLKQKEVPHSEDEPEIEGHIFMKPEESLVKQEPSEDSMDPGPDVR